MLCDVYAGDLFALITCIFVKQWKMHKLVSRDTVVTCLAVFLIPCILGFVYTYAGVFKDGVTVSSAIVNEGACYRDLFSNFVIYIPLILFGFYAMCKKGDNNLVLFWHLTHLYLYCHCFGKRLQVRHLHITSIKCIFVVVNSFCISILWSRLCTKADQSPDNRMLYYLGIFGWNVSGKSRGTYPDT